MTEREFKIILDRLESLDGKVTNYYDELKMFSDRILILEQDQKVCPAHNESYAIQTILKNHSEQHEREDETRNSVIQEVVRATITALIVAVGIAIFLFFKIPGGKP